MKKFVSVLLTLAIMIMCFSCVTFAAISFSIKPSVFLTGDCYNIIWTTTTAGIGKVTYTYQGKTYTAYDEEAGVVRTDDYIHTVTVPQEHLDGAGKYTVTTTEVTARSGYKATTGGTCSGTYNFRGYTGQSRINAWVFSDIHMIPGSNRLSIAKQSINYFTCGTPDIIILNGDIPDDLRATNYMTEGIFNVAYTFSSGNIPVIYSRGNHEGRGVAAPYLIKYLAGETGEFYYNWQYGPISGVTLDFGEDKPDNHPEYGGLHEYESYRLKQTEWLKTEAEYRGNPLYKVALCHGPSIKDHFGQNWNTYLNNIGTDIMVSGHSHGADFGTWGGYSFPTFQEGGIQDGYTEYHGSQMVFENGKITCTTFSSKGTVILADTTITATTVKSVGSSTPSIEAETEVDETEDTKAIPTAYGKVVSETVVGAASYAFLAKPVVFDTGDTYTISFATTAGKNTQGIVYATDASGRTRTYMDTGSGTAKTSEYIHGVNVPKESMDNGSYQVVSRVVTKHNPYTGSTFGNTITTGEIAFAGYNGQSSIDMFMVSNLSGDQSMISTVKNAASGYDMLILGGNTLAKCDTIADVVDGLLYPIGAITGGKIPVAFVRGHNDTVGAYAPYLNDLIDYPSRQFFGKINYGPVSIIALDTAGQLPDSDALYGSLASFEWVRQRQYSWLSKQSYGNATYKLALTANPSLANNLGYKYSRILNSMGTDLALFGYDSLTTYTNIGTNAQNFATAAPTSYSNDGTVGMTLNFNNNVITIKAVGANGAVKSTKTVNVTTNDTSTYTDIEYSSWYADAVNYVSTQQLMVGTSANTFAPEDNLTRAMAVTTLARLENESGEGYDAAPFADTSAGSYYSNALNWAYAKGVVKGVNETEFDPEGTITREQLTAMLYRLYGDKLTSAAEAPFADFDTVSEYAKEAVAAMYEAGIINGMGDNTFAPKAAVTRAMLAQILYKSGF